MVKYGFVRFGNVGNIPGHSSRIRSLYPGLPRRVETLDSTAVGMSLSVQQQPSMFIMAPASGSVREKQWILQGLIIRREDGHLLRVCAAENDNFSGIDVSNASRRRYG